MSDSALSSKDTLVIFTYAPAGLGHLRVTNALSKGLPKTVNTVLLGSHDKSIEAIHKFISIHTVTRKIMEWVQRGKPQNVFTKYYRNYLRKSGSYLIDQFIDILDQRVDVPKNVIVVATHFGLAHQIAAIKKELISRTDVNLKLIVQVTDDSPQYIWYVPGADLIFVPSYHTKFELEEYGKEANLPLVKFKVLPYPISPVLNQDLDKDKVRIRKKQLERNTDEEIHICMPVSGAAIGMLFFNHLIEHLQKKHSRFIFHIVSKDVPFTKEFLEGVKSYPNVNVHTSKHDREIVDLYDDVYEKNIVSLEVTKPSEQAFKALFGTNKAGGSLLLFSNPVGRQEYDNLNFLRRNGLLFSIDERDMLWDKAEKGESMGDYAITKLFEEKGRIRGIELPLGSEASSNFIWWCLSHGIFEKMMEHGQMDVDKKNIEIQSNGVELFWKEIESLFKGYF